MEETVFSIRFEMTHNDVIEDKGMIYTLFARSGYAIHNVSQDSLPSVIARLNEKGYSITGIEPRV